MAYNEFKANGFNLLSGFIVSHSTKKHNFYIVVANLVLKTSNLSCSSIESVKMLEKLQWRKPLYFGSIERLSIDNSRSDSISFGQIEHNFLKSKKQYNLGKLSSKFMNRKPCVSSRRRERKVDIQWKYTTDNNNNK